MNEEIRVNSLITLENTKTHEHLENKLFAVKYIQNQKWIIQEINNKNMEYTSELKYLKPFNPNKWNYKHKNNIFTNKVELIEHIYENGDIDYVIKFDDGRKRNLKECTLIKKETKPMTQKYKVITNLLENFPKDTIIQQYKQHDLYKNISNTGGALSKDLVENNPGFFEKLEFTEENIKILNEQVIKLSIRFNAFGTSEGFIKDFKEFESIVKQMGELL